MTQAGFDSVFVGIETPNEDSLTECSKNQNKGCNLLDQIYAPKSYYDPVLTFLREYQPPKIRFQLDPHYLLLALTRSMYQLGIRGVERTQYWRLFFWALFRRRRPRLFPMAITLPSWASISAR
jgi:hypothetical protein